MDLWRFLVGCRGRGHRTRGVALLSRQIIDWLPFLCQLNGPCFNKSATAEPVTLWIWLSFCTNTKNNHKKSNPPRHPVSKDNNQRESGLGLCGCCWQMGCFILMDHLSLTMPNPPCSYAAAGNNNSKKKKKDCKCCFCDSVISSLPSASA